MGIIQVLSVTNMIRMKVNKGDKIHIFDDGNTYIVDKVQSLFLLFVS